MINIVRCRKVPHMNESRFKGESRSWSLVGRTRPLTGPLAGPLSGPTSGPTSGTTTGFATGPTSGFASGPASGPVSGRARPTSDHERDSH